MPRDNRLNFPDEAVDVTDTVRQDMRTWPLHAVRALVDGVPDGIVVVGPSGRVELHNQAASALFGVPAGGLVGDAPREAWTFVDADGGVLGGEDHPVLAAVMDDVAVTRRSIGVVRDDGPIRWVHVMVRPLGPARAGGTSHAIVLERAPDPRTTGTVASLARPLVAPGEADEALDRLFGQQVVGMVQMDVDSTVVRANDAVAAMLRTEPAAMVGTRMVDLVAPEDLARERRALRRVASGATDHHAVELTLDRADGSTVTVQIGVSAIRDVDGSCRWVIGQLVDVSRLRRAEDFMSRRALFDPLTQLINRTLLIDLLSDQLRVRDNPLAVLALNLDRFKAVNDSLGQSSGDGVLVEVADRLRAALQPGDAAARISGDDFVLLCGDVTTPAEADALTRRVLDAIAEPIEVDGLRIQLTASAGVTLVTPQSGLTGDEVITQATQALKHAKERGRARWKVYDAEMRTASTDRLWIETSLRTALDEGRLHVAYQPLQDLRSGRVVGAEALVRWHDPVVGDISPRTFLPVAEESGLIVPLGHFVLGEATAAAARWRDLTGRPLYVSVNLSPHELDREGIVDRVGRALDTARLPSTALRLEITESVLVDADEQVRHNLTELHAAGVAIGIDDFGTGYASMAYLKALPLDFVKVDQSFVAGVGASREDTAIVRATLELAQALNLVTIAEGIETAGQLDALRDLGCDVGQGYLIGHPGPAAAILEHVGG